MGKHALFHPDHEDDRELETLGPMHSEDAHRFEVGVGTPVTVRVRRPGGEIWEIQSTMARSADGSHGMISRRGLGLAIDEAPPAFHEFVAELEGDDRIESPRLAGRDDEVPEGGD